MESSGGDSFGDSKTVEGPEAQQLPKNHRRKRTARGRSYPTNPRMASDQRLCTPVRGGLGAAESRTVPDKDDQVRAKGKDLSGLSSQRARCHCGGSFFSARATGNERLFASGLVC